MNEELIKFIELCLSDGVITEKEREVIFRKSKELGVPDDECEILIDSLVSKYSKKTSPPKPTKKKGGFFSSMFNEIKKNIDTDSIKSSFNKVKDDIKKGYDIEKEKIEKELKKTTSSNKPSKTKITSPKSVNTNKPSSSKFYSCDEVDIIVKYPESMEDGRVYDLSGNRVYKISKTMREKSFKNKSYLGRKEFDSGTIRWVEINPDEVENKLNDSEFIEVHSLKTNIGNKNSLTQKSSRKNIKKEVKSLDTKEVVFEHVFKDYFFIEEKKLFIESFKLLFTKDEIIVLFNERYHRHSEKLINPYLSDYFKDKSELFIEQNQRYVGNKLISLIRKEDLLNSSPNKILIREKIKSIEDKRVRFEIFDSDSDRMNIPEPKFNTYLLYSDGREEKYYDPFDRYNLINKMIYKWGDYRVGDYLKYFSLFNIPSRFDGCTTKMVEEEEGNVVKSINLILKGGTEKYLSCKSLINNLNLELVNIRNSKDEFIIDSDIYFEVLKKNQKQIVEIDREYVQKFIKLNNYLKEKSKSLLLILDKTISNCNIKPKEEVIFREEENKFFRGLLYSYNLMVNHSIVMVSSLVEDDMITFYEIYEVFDKMNVFNTNWENEVNNKLSEINESLQDLNFSIRGLMNQMRSMERNVVNGLQSINTSIGSLENSVNKQLSETNSRLKYENLTNYYKKLTIPGSMDWFDGPK
jgi:hypothetical protein